MIRAAIRFLILFLIPLAVYLAWVWYRTRYVARHGGEAPKWEQGPWPLMLFLGAVLVVATLLVSTLQHGGGPGTEYTPSYLKDGEVVPGTTTPIKP
jgi:hypothetical protein